MATIRTLTPDRKPIRHYALLTMHGTDIAGIATKVAGGYSFLPEGGTHRRLCSYNDPALVLLGRVDIADAQRAADQAAGGFAALVCGYGNTERR